MASGMPANRHRSSIDSPTSPYSPSGLSSIGSNSQLVLLPDTEDGDSYDEFDSDDEADDDNELGSRLESRNLSIPPLAPSVVFLYLLSPYLRLGAINIPDGDTPLKYGLASLVIATVLSAFCRHIWFLLGRYLRKSTTEDILVHTFARGRGRGRKHVFARRTITAVIALFRILMAAMYLRDSVGCVLPLVPETLPFRSHLSTSALLGFLVLVFSLAKSLAAKPTICLAGLSVASFLAWVITVSHAYATNGLQPSPSWLQRGVLWNEISSIIFACTTALTVPLSASLTGGTMVPPAAKKQRARSFQLLSTSSTALAALLMLPLVIFAASPRTPETSETAPDALISLSRAATLLLSVPSIILSIPSLPFPRGIYRNTPINPSKLLIIFAVVALSLVPPPIAGILNDATLFLAVSGTFMLPALAHITIHYFRRPLSIVVPQGPSSVPSTPRTAHAQLSPPPSPDPLLQRKERLLQRSRLGKRLLWDIGIWIILIPICGCALVWAGGRLALQW